MAFINSFSVFLITVVIVICLWIKNKLNYWKKRDIITPEYSYIWGNMKSAIQQKESFTGRCSRFYNFFKSKNLKHGGLYMIWSPMYVPIDINIIKHIMQVDFQHFMDRGVYVNEKADPLTAHLFAIEGKKWKLLRNKLSPTFTSGKMKMMFETMVNCTKGLSKVMDKDLGSSVEIKDILGRFTTDIIGSCAFGLDCNSLENPESEFRIKGKAVFQREFWENVKQFLIFSFTPLMKMLNVKALPTDISEFFMNVVRDTVKYREDNNISRKDFMHLLIQLKNKGKLVDDEKLDSENISQDENKITLNEIAAQVFIFFEAGFETSSTTMTFCLYELAKNKDIQEKVRREIKTVLKRYDDNLTYEAVMDMHYLEKTINETLRKYPPLPSLNRICTKEYKVPGTDLVIEKGVRVLIPVFGIHHDPEFYPDPEKFDPERFTEENKKTRPHFTFLPFGEGPRVCIGTRFGYLQTKVGLISLLLNYNFSISKKLKEPIEFQVDSFFPSTEGGMWLDFEKIDNIDLTHTEN